MKRSIPIVITAGTVLIVMFFSIVFFWIGQVSLPIAIMIGSITFAAIVLLRKK